MGNAIVTEGLTKFYGKSRGIEDLDLEVKEGEVFGFLGPNGAGKSTTIRLLLGFLRPSSGSATVLGMDTQTQSVELHRRIGYLAGDFVTYESLTGNQVINLIASLRGGVDRAYVSELIERYEFDPTRPIRALSKGNRQKIGLIQAVMNRPDVLILDEPTAGLDPLVQREFNDYIAEVKAEGRTVFVSSHILPEVEAICDRVGVIRDGRLVTVEEVASLTQKSVRKVQLQFASDVPAGLFHDIPGVVESSNGNGLIELTVAGSITEIVKVAAANSLVNLWIHEPNLEEVFMRFYEEETEHAT